MAQLSSPEKSPFAGRRLLFAGVAAAALMGVGLGLWARPATSERQSAPAPAEMPASDVGRSLQIVIDDTPAPLGKPIEVLPADGPPPRAMLPPERLPPEPMAPVRPLAGFVRVQSVAPRAAEPTPPRVAPKPAAKTAPAKAAPQPRPVAKARPALQLAKAPTVKAKPPRIEKVKLVEKPRPKPPATKIARSAPRPAKPAKADIRLARLDRHEKPARIEKAQAPRPAKPGKLSGVVHAIARAAPRKAEPPAKLQMAKAERKAPKAARPRVEKAAVKTAKARPMAIPARAVPVRALAPAKGAGPLRLAKYTPRTDQTVSDADRQMNRAYSNARAAGVPDWQLRRQQQRWEAARASAAREAPWAVHDVYLARIAELHDLTRDAEGPGY